MSNSVVVDNTVAIETSQDHPPVSGTTREANASEPSSFFQLVRKYATVSDVLRMGGALAVAIAMGIFLLEGVEVVNDLYRFLTMLGLTAALTAAGFLMSMLLKEQRGSRVFISLGLLSIPVNFTVFGALIYSVMPLDTMAINYPEFAHWQAASATDITVALISGLAVLAPVVWLGFSVLARSARGWLSMTLLLSCAVLIIPVRHEIWAALLALTSTAVVLWQCQKYSKDSLALKTPEGRFAVALLFVAPVVVAVRSLFLYEVSGVLVLTLGSGIYLTMRQLMVQKTEASAYSALLTILAGIATLVVGISGSEVIRHYVSNDLALIGGSIAILLLALDIKTVSPSQQAANRVGVTLVTVATSAIVLLSLSSTTSVITLAGVVVLVAVAVYGYLYKHTVIVTIACLGAAAIAILNAEEMWLAVVQTGWWGIAAAGALAIVSGSILDRAGTVVEVKRKVA